MHSIHDSTADVSGVNRVGYGRNVYGHILARINPKSQNGNHCLGNSRMLFPGYVVDLVLGRCGSGRMVSSIGAFPNAVYLQSYSCCELALLRKAFSGGRKGGRICVFLSRRICVLPKRSDSCGNMVTVIWSSLHSRRIFGRC